MGQIPARVFTRNLQLVEDTEMTLVHLREMIHRTPAQFEDFGTLSSDGQQTDVMRRKSTTWLERMNHAAHEALNYLEELAERHDHIIEQARSAPLIAPWLQNTAKLPPRRHQ